MVFVYIFSCFVYLLCHHHLLQQTPFNNKSSNYSMAQEASSTKISYGTGSHPLNSFLVYDSIKPFNNDYALPPLIYIHGGAWRDPSNTANDIDTISTKLNKTIPLFSVNYRLSPEVKYPSHLHDVHEAILKIIQITYPSSTTAENRKVALIGHSVGATLILQLLSTYNDIDVDQIYLLDGIYDLPELLAEYPSYKSFVDEAHEDYTTVEKYNWEKIKKVRQIHVVQSYQDELLSLNQTKWLTKQFESHKIGYVLKVDNLGKHDDVYQDERVANYINTSYY